MAAAILHLKCLSVFMLVNAVLVSCHPLTGETRRATCQACYPLDKDKINIHLIPHSHDDVGWLKTVDQYYYGTKKKIQYAGVQYIISSVVEALKLNPDRRFIQVETAFLWRWWKHQDETTKQDVIRLVQNGQLELTNGAWSMNDEATTNYQSIIDQFTWGLRFLNDTFGECGRPKVGWQIDPFGHSREHASIMSQMGFQALVLGRMDYRDKQQRLSEKNLDFVWKSSASLDDSEIFATVLPDFYNWLDGFCFDVTCVCEPIVDDPDSIEYNLHNFVATFSSRMSSYKRYYRTNNFLVPMGGDFNYQVAEVNYSNIDKLIKGFQNHTDFNMFYSTPSCYVRAVYDEIKSKSLTMKTKSDDFFPYASDMTRYWTGYFTSRPALKRLERTGNSILQAAKHLTAFSRITGRDLEGSLEDLRDVMGILQHHDAITGTEKQAVANDYVKLLCSAIKTAEESSGAVIGDLLQKQQDVEVDLKLESCMLSNISICEVSIKQKFVVVVYNPLSRVVTHHVRLPVTGEYGYKIAGPDGEEEYDVNDAISGFEHVKEKTKPAAKELIFAARSVPPLGLKAYHIEGIEKLDAEEPTFTEVSEEDNSFGTDLNGFSIDPSTGGLSSVTIRGVTRKITQNFYYYLGDNHGFSSSGAYAFIPVNPQANVLSTGNVTVKAKRGKLVDEVVQVYASNLTQIIRAYKDDPGYVEFDWLIGDLVTGYANGKEVISRFVVEDFDNGEVFYTDSNGRELIRRQLNTRSDYSYTYSQKSVTSNYYPVTSRIVIEDEQRNLRVAVLNDRSQGGSSLEKGAMELMIHRKLLKDDGFGVLEALAEQEYNRGLFVRGQHYLTFGPINSEGKSTAALERDLAQKKLLTPWILLANAENYDSLETLPDLMYFEFQGLSRSLPENVQILTLEPWRDDTYLLRLEHILEKDDDVNLSQTATVDLTNLFTLFDITEIGETTLGANQWWDDYEIEEKFVWTEDMHQFWRRLDADDPLKIELQPMQIRTFLIKIQLK